jgi:hypothetical protein
MVLLPRQDGSFDLLDRARAEFGEQPNRGSEPDIIVMTDNAMFLLKQRFWLLGTWKAERLNMPFCLINLVIQEREINIEREFGRHILQNDNRVFKRHTGKIFTDMSSRLAFRTKKPIHLKNISKTKPLAIMATGN